MRVIAGSARGIRIAVPRGGAVRPTTDRARETLFSVLGDDVAGARAVDLFAGSGALGIEALSRGAAHCTFVEADAATVKVLRGNLERTRLSERATVVRSDWRAGLRRLGLEGAFDLALMDPPYRMELGAEVMEAITTARVLTPRAWIVLEHGGGESPPAPATWECFRRLEIGETCLSLYRCVEPAAAPC
jgi:16S rRNA (guanine(966)-N(2))-methyltransferase RsmD